MRIDKKALILLGFLLGGVAFAAVTNILSNTLTVNVTAQKPIVLKFLGASNKLDIVENTISTNENFYSGDSVWVKVQIENKANNPISIYPICRVTSAQGISNGLLEVERVYLVRGGSQIDITNWVFCVEGGNTKPLRNCSRGGEVILTAYNLTNNSISPFIIPAETSKTANVTVKFNSTFEGSISATCWASYSPTGGS